MSAFGVLHSQGRLSSSSSRQTACPTRPSLPLSARGAEGVESLNCKLVSCNSVAISVAMFESADRSCLFEEIAADCNCLAIQCHLMRIHIGAERLKLSDPAHEGV